MKLWLVYSILASIVWGIQYNLIARLVAGVPPTVLLLWGFVVDIPLLLVATFFFQDQLISPGLLEHKGAFVLARVLGVVGTLLIWFSMRTSNNATASSMVEMSYPFFVGLFAYLLFDRREMTPSMMIGGVVVLFGLYLIANGATSVR
jgi:drug/metabolite transporter (DMT)-like permease